MAKPQRDHDALAWRRLRLFEERAHDVLACDLAKRVDLETLGSTMRILRRLGDPAGTWRIERDEPPGAEVDQAIGYVRPFFLKQDEVHHANVTAALKRLTQQAPSPARELVQLLRNAWKDFPRGSRYAVAVATEGPPELSAMRSDRDIAEDYVYGRYIHDDPERRARIRHLPEGEARMAALLWAKDAILLTQATQQLLVDLETDGQLRG